MLARANRQLIFRGASLAVIACSLACGELIGADFDHLRLAEGGAAGVAGIENAASGGAGGASDRAGVTGGVVVRDGSSGGAGGGGPGAASSAGGASGGGSDGSSGSDTGGGVAEAGTGGESGVGGSAGAPSRNWGAEVQLSTSDVETAYWQAVMGPEGNISVVWQTRDATIESARFDVEVNDWLPATRIDAGSGDASAATLAVDAQGTVTAAWVEVEGGRGSIWFSRRRASESDWAPASLLETEDLAAQDPSLGVMADGTVVVVYSQAGELRASRYETAADSWSAPFALATGDVGWRGDGEFASHLDGTTWLLWSDLDGFWWTRHAGDWSSAVRVPSDGYVFDSRLFVDESGGAWFFWSDGDSIRYATFGVDETSWSEQNTLGTAPNPSLVNWERPRVVGDAAGNLLVAWHHQDIGQAAILYSRYSNSEATWSEPLPVSTEHANSVHDLALTQDAHGGAYAAWFQTTDNMVWTNAYEPGSASFGEAESLGAGGQYAGVFIFVDDADRRTVVWGRGLSDEPGVIVARRLE